MDASDGDLTIPWEQKNQRPISAAVHQVGYRKSLPLFGPTGEYIHPDRDVKVRILDFLSALVSSGVPAEG